MIVEIYGRYVLYGFDLNYGGRDSI
jgi:hypothetical protein